MPPIIAIVGHSGAGKTSFIELLLPELVRRGLRVATIKHVPRHLDLGGEGKDSQRHLAAGSSAIVISAPQMVALQMPVANEVALPALAKMLGEDYDLVLAEGFKQADVPKIQVYRAESGPLLTELSRQIAVVSDEPVETTARRFATSDVKGVADLLENGFVQPGQRKLSLYVNGEAVPLKAFPARFIGDVLLAMAGSLEGVTDIHRLEVELRQDARPDLKNDTVLGYKLKRQPAQQKEGTIGQEETA